MSLTKLNNQDILEKINRRNFEDLFLDLGWRIPPPPRPLNLETDNGNIKVKPVARMATVTAWECSASEWPLNSKTKYQVDKELNKRSVERLLIFLSDDESKQEWVWADAKRSGGYTRKTISHDIGAENEDLCQRLRSVYFGPKDQKLPTHEIIKKVRRNFDTEKVTQKFFKEFTKCRKGLAEDIKGLAGDESEGDKFWYSVLLLNRLMFIYFLQKKEFINSDDNYLQSSLKSIQKLKGKDKFFGYYKDFLLPLFHTYLGSGNSLDSEPEVAAIIGKVPYINGSIFSKHHLEENNEIEIPDAAFENIFTLFDNYQWHLDSRETGNPKEINPDILGHIFEQHVNQKGTGSYYTKEDITQYMCSQTIAPLFIERVQNTVGEKLRKELWATLHENPREFIPDALFYGEKYDETKPKFATWNGGRKERDDGSFPDPLDPWLDEKDPECTYRLLDETRREALERISWGQEIEKKITAGEIADLNECITLNLELGKLATAWISNTNSEEIILKAWDEIRKIRVLDPTVGSGAFLRAALDMLQDIYEAIFNSIDRFDIKSRAKNGEPLKTSDSLIQEIKNSSDKKREYLIRRTIIINNLYGNELQPEAAEVCQLRLFLSLAAALDDPGEIEPLPDLEFNIRSGNLLVGAETPEDAESRYSNSLFLRELIEELEKSNEENAKLHSDFNRAQDKNEIEKSNEIKIKIKKLESRLRDILDRLAMKSQTEGTMDKNLEKWRSTHRPFHWFVEFPEVMKNEGFDVIVGNPPFISKKNNGYIEPGFVTDHKCPDIYAPCMERSARLLKGDGRFAMISPISLTASTEFEKLREILHKSLSQIWVTAFSLRPAKLFGAEVCPAITIASKMSTNKNLYTSQLRRLTKRSRPYIFSITRFSQSTSLPEFESIWPLVGKAQIYELSSKLVGGKKSIKSAQFSVGYKKIAGRRFLSAFITDPPKWESANGKPGKRIEAECGWLNFDSKLYRDITFLFLAGRIGQIVWSMVSDAFNVTTKVVTWKSMDSDAFNAHQNEISNFVEQLDKAQQASLTVNLNSGQYIGNYDLSKCRHITDRSDQFILKTLNLDPFFPDVLLADNWLTKSKPDSSTKPQPRDWTPTYGPWHPGDPE